MVAGNFTMTPNWLFGLIPIMSEPELKVTFATVRETVGRHKDSAGISLSEYETLTGLSRTAVDKGLRLAQERGTIMVIGTGSRRKKFYGFNADYTTTTTSSRHTIVPKTIVPVVNVDQSEDATSSPGLPLNTKKEVLKEKRKKRDSEIPKGISVAPEISTSHNPKEVGTGAFNQPPLPTSDSRENISGPNLTPVSNPLREEVSTGSEEQTQVEGEILGPKVDPDFTVPTRDFNSQLSEPDRVLETHTVGEQSLTPSSAAPLPPAEAKPKRKRQPKPKADGAPTPKPQALYHDALLAAFGLDPETINEAADKPYWHVAAGLYCAADEKKRFPLERISELYEYVKNKAQNWTSWTVYNLAKYSADFLRDCPTPTQRFEIVPLYGTNYDAPPDLQEDVDGGLRISRAEMVRMRDLIFSRGQITYNGERIKPHA